MGETLKLDYVPGTVFVVRSNGWAGFMIRLGAALMNKPNLANHVAVWHHVKDGVPWGIEGRAGGVGWVDMRKYLRSKWTVTNVEQPISKEQSEQLAALMPTMLGTDYDWTAIVRDTFRALHIPELFSSAFDWKGQGVPGQVVCSSLAAYWYRHLSMPHPGKPGDERDVQPADWSEWIIEQGWNKQLRTVAD